MTISYTVVTVENGVATVTFTDSVTKLSQTKSINVGDLDKKDHDTRFAEHQNAFEHRLSLGLIKPPEAAPVEEKAAKKK